MGWLTTRCCDSQNTRSDALTSPTLFEFTMRDYQSREGVFQQGRGATQRKLEKARSCPRTSTAEIERAVSVNTASETLLELAASSRKPWFGSTNATIPHEGVSVHGHAHTAHSAVSACDSRALASGPHGEMVRLVFVVRRSFLGFVVFVVVETLVFLSLPLAPSLVSIANLGRKEPKVLSYLRLNSI